MNFPSPPLRVSTGVPAEFSNRAITCAPTIAAPLGSVNVPLIVAVDCACVTAGIAKSKTSKNPAARPGMRRSLIFPPLPLARELKVVPMRSRSWRARIRIETPPVSWLGGVAPKIQGLLDESKQQRGLPIPATNLDDSLRETVARAENHSALQSRGGDGFSPSSRARSLL